MAKQLGILSPEAIEKLRRDHETLARQLAELQQFVRALAARGDTEVIVLGKTDGSGISAESSGTPGSGTVTIYRKPAGETDVQSTSYDVTCYNLAGAVDADTFVIMGRDAFGRYWALVERC